LAVANYHEVNGCYPPAYIADADGKPMHSWRVLLLPYLEQQVLFEKYDFSQPWNSEANQRLASDMPATYAFHGSKQPGAVVTNFLAVVGEETAWPGAASRMTDDVVDERSTTILIVENAGRNVHWMEPRDLDFDTMDFQVNSPMCISSKYLKPAAVMLDGTLRKLDADLPVDVLRALLTVNGGEQLTAEGEHWQLLPDGRLREVHPPPIESPK